MKREIPNALSAEVLDRYDIVNNTFKQEVKDNPKDRIQVEIGDIKQPDFKPQVKIMRWDNEVNFSMRAQEHPDAVIETEGKLIKYVTPEYEVHQYELDPGDIGEDGGLEFEWVLPSKPLSNVLTATIQTKELDFFYQPALTQEEIDEGSQRPENVAGSYAVYHKTKGGINDAAGMEYKVGKAFHIYRPKVTDANGQEVWGELNIDTDNGLLTVTVDQNFLNKAMYPVVVDPTFGYSTKGASLLATAANRFYGYRFASPSDVGEITSMSAYVTVQNAVNFNKLLIVLLSNLNIVSNGVSNPYDPSTTGDQLETVTFSSNPTLSVSTDYLLGFIGDSGQIDLYYDTGAANYSYFDSTNSYSTPTNPTDATNTGDSKYSIYATYAADSGNDEFGNINSSSSYVTLGTDDWIGILATSPASATQVTSIKMRLGIHAGTPKVKGVLVNSSTLEIMGVGDEQTVPTGPEWVTSTFATPINITGGDDYIPGFVIDSNTVRIYQGGVLTTGRYETDNNYSSPTTIVSPTVSSGTYSIYATTTSAAGTAKGIHMTTNTMFWGS